ncbi:hypothetical protein Ct61P_05137 [Colletotrichum tofieldiae]|nr:hypothetical protein Ct61P_05137 [Colletotrichum tofieldiae]
MQLWSHEATKDALKQDAPTITTMPKPSASKSKAGDEPHTPLPSPPTPVALCGKTEQIGRGVIAGLKPEYEGKPWRLSHDRQRQLRRRPRAVILGGAFDDAATAVLREAVAGARAQSADVRKVPWLRQDSSKPAPPLGPEYGKAMVVRVKEALARLQGEGKLDGSYEGDEWY